MKKVSAIAGLIFTVVLGIAGFSGYSAGTHYIEFFGIELSQGAFMGLIGVLLVWDVVALRGAMQAGKQMEALGQEARERFDGAQAMADSSTVSVHRIPSALGAAMGVRVFHNGNEVGVLKSGQTLQFPTRHEENELTVHYNADGVTKTLPFTAQPGGRVFINLKYAGAVLSQIDGAQMSEARGDGTTRVRPVKVGYILWSLTNLWCYLLGLVPLIYTLKAAKEPHDEMAERRLKIARVWNIVMSCLLVLILVGVVGPRIWF